MATNEETNAAGTDTRLPMLVEDTYIRGKPNGKLIWKSIQNGPTPHPMITDPPPTDSTVVPAPRKKLDSEFNEEENKLEMADTQAEIILSQGLPRHIFNNLNQTSTAKEIWDNVELLMQGSGRTLQQRKEDLFDEYERFRFYLEPNQFMTTFVRFPQAWMNDHEDYSAQHSNTSDETTICPTTFRPIGIYTQATLKATEPHAKKTLKKQEHPDNATNHPVNDVTLQGQTNLLIKWIISFESEMHQEEHLDSDAETEIDDNTIPYHQYLLDTEAQNVPTEVSADTSDKVSMIAILTDLQTQLERHARQEQALVIQRNKRNAELVQENDLLKSTLSGKEKSIAFLQSEKEKILSEKKETINSYLMK
ncbi:hypothetical protein Tco_0622516 [Tanacetum coccineum]